MKRAMILVAVAVITSATSFAQASAPARQPGGAPPQQPGEMEAFACKVETDSVVLEEIAKAIGTWKDLGPDSLQTDEGRKQYETNQRIFSLLENSNSALYKLIQSFCSNKSK